MSLTIPTGNQGLSFTPNTIVLPTTSKEAKAQAKVIIQAFGLPAMETLVYAGAIASLGGRDALRRPSTDQYNGKLGIAPTSDAPVGKTGLGTPVWDRLIIQGGSYINSQNTLIKYNDIQLDTVLITLSQTHNVVTTVIQGADNEVVEYIGKMSYRINIKGGIFSSNNIRPVAQIQELKNMLNSNRTLIIKQCSFLTHEWDITEMAVLDKSIPQMPGGYNYQLFEFNAIQDLPVFLAQKQIA